jgi:hypothetical protein
MHISRPPDRISTGLLDYSIRGRSIACAGLFREVFLELAGLAVHLLGFVHRVLLDGDVRPLACVFGIDLQPFVEARLGIGLDRLGRTFRLADAAVDALIGMMTRKFSPS